MNWNQLRNLSVLLPSMVAAVGTVGRTQQAVVAIALSEDGRLIAAARQDGEIVIVDAGNLRETRLVDRFAAPMPRVAQLAFVDADAKLALVGTRFALCDRHSGQPVAPGDQVPIDAADDDLALAIAPDGMRVAIQSSDGSVRVVDAHDGICAAVIEFEETATPRPVAFSCDGDRVLILTANGHRWSWDWNMKGDPDLLPRIGEVIRFFDQRNGREVVVKSRGVTIGDRSIFVKLEISAARSDRNRSLVVLLTGTGYLALDAGGDELFRFDPRKEDLPGFEAPAGFRTPQPFTVSANGSVLAIVAARADVALVRHGKFAGKITIH